MRSSTIITLLGAGLAIASPIVKKALVIEVVTDVVYTTVTETIPPTSDQVTTIITLEVIPTQDSSSTSSTSTSTSTTSTTTSTMPPPDTPTPTPTPTPVTEAPAPTSDVVVVPATSEPPAAAASTPSPSPIQDAQTLPTDYVSAVLYHHNVHRANHSAADATYDTTLANNAAVLAATCNFHHDLTIGGGGYGQNIYLNGSSDFTADFGPNPAIQVAYAITAAWYNGEVNSFNYYGQDNPGGSLDSWGHFTQVVWATSNKVGCATQLCLAGTMYPNMGAYFTVCNYSPEGNVGGEYATNVGTSLNHGTVNPE